jgi:hypothetical protein
MKLGNKNRIKQKSIPKLKKEVETVCNRFVRLRDDGKPCISCGQFRLLQAGHFFPVKGYDGLRFDEMNIHGECERCNGFDDAHLIFYEENLRERIGVDEMNQLKDRARKYRMNGYKFTRTELVEKKEYFTRKIAELYG